MYKGTEAQTAPWGGSGCPDVPCYVVGKGTWSGLIFKSGPFSSGIEDGLEKGLARGWARGGTAKPQWGEEGSPKSCLPAVCRIW